MERSLRQVDPTVHWTQAATQGFLKVAVLNKKTFSGKVGNLL